MLSSKALAIAIVIAMLSVVIVPVCGSAEEQQTATVMKELISPIVIDGNADFAAQARTNRWSGDGSSISPYYLSDLSIASDVNSCAISIVNTTAFFVITDCVIAPSNPDALNWESYSCGVYLRDVTNGRISNVTVTSFIFGINLERCGNVAVDNCTVTDQTSTCINVRNSNHVTVENNTVFDAHSTGICGRYSNDLRIQCNNATHNNDYGFDLDFRNDNCIVRWNIASFNCYALGITGEGSTIYGNVFVAAGTSYSKPVEIGVGSDNDWDFNGVGNYYGTNYDQKSRAYTGFLGTAICSHTDKNGDGISDETYSMYDCDDVASIDHFPLIYPVSAPRNLIATASGSDTVTLCWDEPLFSTCPFGHYVVVRDDGVTETRINVTGTSYVDVIADVDNWTTVQYRVMFAGRFLTSGLSDAAVGQNPDRPSVEIVSELGIAAYQFGSEVLYLNTSIDPRSVLVEWNGFDSNSATMNYFVKLDGGEWLDNGQVSDHTFNDLAEGEHIVVVRAVDSDGNSAEDAKTFTVYRYVQMSVVCTPYLEDGKNKLLLNGSAWDAVTNESMAGISVDLAYSIDGGSSWAMSSGTTGSNGKFQFSIGLELATKMGIVICAMQNDLNGIPHFFYLNTTYVAVNLDGRDGVFLTQSTATISGFQYSSNMIRFNVSAAAEDGSTTILVPKGAVDDINDVTVEIDGENVDFTTEEMDDYWVLTVDHDASSHEVHIDIAEQKVLGMLSEEMLLLFIIVIVAIACLGIGIFVIRKKRKA